MHALRVSAAIAFALVTAAAAFAATQPAVTVTIAAIPAQTKSVEIDIYHVGGKTPGKSEGPWLFNVTPSSQGCARSRDGFTCRRPIPMPYGTFDFSVTAFPRKDVDGNPIARGKTTATLTQTQTHLTLTLHPSQ